MPRREADGFDLAACRTPARRPTRWVLRHADQAAPTACRGGWQREVTAYTSVCTGRRERSRSASICRKLATSASGERFSGNSRCVVSAHFEREANRASALANAGGVQMIANLPSDEFRCGRQRMERVSGTENGVLADLQRAVGAANNQAFEPAAIQ